MKFNDYKESFKYYKSIKSNRTEYFTKHNKFILHSTFDVEGLIDENIELPPIIVDNEKRVYVISVVKDDAVKRFHPNNINNKDFWKISKNEFSLISVCGTKSDNIADANKKTLDFSINVGLFNFLKSNIKKTDNILEIGFGYGNVHKKIKNHCNYVGIDYTKPKFLRKFNNLHTIDISGIPENLKIDNYYDYIYSVNVLQHCSQKDRFEYFKQGYDVLKKDGYFIFSCNLMTDINKDGYCWGFKDSSGRGYTHFFNQLTECDYEDELKEYLYKLGFKIKDFRIIGPEKNKSNNNLLICLLQK